MNYSFLTPQGTLASFELLREVTKHVQIQTQTWDHTLSAHSPKTARPHHLGGNLISLMNYE